MPDMATQHCAEPSACLEGCPVVLCANHGAQLLALHHGLDLREQLGELGLLVLGLELQGKTLLLLAVRLPRRKPLLDLQGTMS